ncbi:MAG: FAD-dependent monooxygenase, partial [Betaproteobacteria bacterium]|nr:FAD-dependent monooxygenase [Betaproteobacteria bacterium]
MKPNLIRPPRATDAESVLKTFAAPRFEWRAAPEQYGDAAIVHKVAVIGAGPVGLTAALDLAQRGVRVV